MQDLVGRDILVGMTLLAAGGEVLRQEQFHGLIDDADDDSPSILSFDGGEQRSIPTDLGAIRPAHAGRYWLASSGRVVPNP